MDLSRQRGPEGLRSEPNRSGSDSGASIQHLLPLEIRGGGPSGTGTGTGTGTEFGVFPLLIFEIDNEAWTIEVTAVDNLVALEAGPLWDVPMIGLGHVVELHP